MFFGEVPVVKCAFFGLNITLLASFKVARFCGKTADLATQVWTKGCQVSQQNPHNLYSKPAQSHFRWDLSVKIVIQGVKYMATWSTAVQNMKRQCRKAERMWRKTKLEIHYSIYKDSLHAFNLELATARQTFFSNLINSNLNNTRTLFATVERLTNPPSQIPSEMLSDSKCNEFASFFSEKISNIRKEIGTSSCNTGVTQIRQQSQKEVTMSVFKTIDSKILEEIVQHLKSSTCYLDTLPTSFFKSVLNCLEADLLEVVNTSLLSGTFPNSLKTAVVKPLLKKRNLDNTMLSNYRPISNLPFIGKIIEKVVFNQLNNYLNSNGLPG